MRRSYSNKSTIHSGKSKNLSNSLSTCMSSIVGLANLHDECNGQMSSNKRGSWGDLRLISGTKTVFKRMGDNLEKYVKNFRKDSYHGYDSKSIAQNIQVSAKEITKNNDEFRKLKASLRATGNITNYGLIEVLPDVIALQSKENVKFSTVKTNKLQKPNKSTITFTALSLEKRDFRIGKHDSDHSVKANLALLKVRNNAA